VNDVKPYHKALPIGVTNSNNNTNNYSTWKYNLVPTYGVIKTGTNKITSKLICQKKNNADAGNSSTPLAKFYSINITGAPTTTIKQQEQILKHSTKSSNSGKTASPSLNNNNSNKTVPIVKKQKPSLLPINSTKITGAGGGSKTTTATVAVQTGNRSQQNSRSSQSTVSAATLLSNAVIKSSSSNKGNTQTSGTTTNSNSNSNINHGHGKSVSSGASGSSTKTDNHNFIGENLVSRKQQTDTSPVNEPIHTDSINKNMTVHNSNNDIKKLSTLTTLSNNRVFIPKTNTTDTRKHVDQSVGSIQEPQLPNGNNKIPFVMATPMHHITNGTTTSPASDQPISVTLALNLVDKTRVVGYTNGIPIPSH